MSIKFISVNKLPKVPIPQSHGVKHYKNVAYYSVPNDGINCAFAGVAIWAGAFHTKPMDLAAKVRQRVTKFIEESYPDQTALLGQLNANGPVDKVIFRYIAELFGIRMHVLSFDVKHPARVGKQDVLEIYNADLREKRRFSFLWTRKKNTSTTGFTAVTLTRTELEQSFSWRTSRN